MLENEKPKFRGRIHQIAFYKTIFISLLCGIKFIVRRKFSIELIIYLISQLILYGVSSTYHLTSFKTDKIRKIFQKLDHCSIFILIAGTQTSVFLLILQENRNALRTFLTITWSIALIGVLKILILERIIEAVDVAIYIIHGVCVLPFFQLIIKNVKIYQVILFFAGGILYILGGLVFGFERPDPFPLVFGYHEVFHAFTVAANLCFMVPIFIKSFKI